MTVETEEGAIDRGRQAEAALRAIEELLTRDDPHARIRALQIAHLSLMVLDVDDLVAKARG